MASTWKLDGLTWKQLAGRVARETLQDDVFGKAAQLSYYFLLALFPLLLFLMSLLGSFADAGSELRSNLLRYLGTIVPGSAFILINNFVTDISESSGSGKLSLGILLTLWAASNGMGAIIESLNAAYDLTESRPWWKTRLIAVGLTIALATLIITALSLVLYGHGIAATVAARCGLGEAFELAWKILQWPIVLGFVLLAFGLVYYLAPNVRNQKWQWVSPGAVVGVVLWLVVSFGFRLYLNFFDSYSATYGSLGAVIILMLWFYMTGASILIGGEVNAEIERATGKEKQVGGRKDERGGSPAR